MLSEITLQIVLIIIAVLLETLILVYLSNDDTRKKVLTVLMGIIIVGFMFWGAYEFGRSSAATADSSQQTPTETTQIIEEQIEVTRVVEVPVTRIVNQEVEVTRVVEVDVFPEYENCVNVINHYINAVKSGNTVGFQLMASRIRNNGAGTRYGYVTYLGGISRIENDQLYSEGLKVYSDRDNFNPDGERMLC